MAPFTHLTQKDQKKSRGIEVDSAFQSLKTSFITYPLLIHARLPNLLFWKQNAFNFAVGTILSQLEKDNVFHHVSFCFHKFFLAEINYEIHGKNLH